MVMPFLDFYQQLKVKDLPWARLWSHAFQGPGGWFIENSLTTLNKKYPISESNSFTMEFRCRSRQRNCKKKKKKTYLTLQIF